MKIAVCEVYPEMMAESDEWKSLVKAVKRHQPDVLLLNEMPFGPWIAAGEKPDREILARAQRLHENGTSALHDFRVPTILGTRAVDQGGRSVNEAFVWTVDRGLAGVHTKQYFPDEPGFYEARWFQAGERQFRIAEAGALRAGFLICSEAMFNEHARSYGRRGANLIAVPRATPPGSLQRWLVAMRMAAIVSGCYVASSNRGGTDSNGTKFGGCGWIVDPNGDVVAQTSAATPVACYEMDLDFVSRTQREYPHYIPELQ